MGSAAAGLESLLLPALQGQLLWLFHLTTSRNFFKPCQLCTGHAGESAVSQQ
jgi:hypothetical protein